jgi:hypothetical protein
MEMLKKNKFMKNDDVENKRYEYIKVLKMCKMIINVIGNVMDSVVDENKK